jgi:hypothetical protein
LRRGLAARIGGTAPSQTISPTNSAPDIYTEGLTASFGATSTPFTASGSVTNLAAQGTSTALSVALGTATAGSFSVTAGVNFTSSRDRQCSGQSVGGGSVSLAGNVYTSGGGERADGLAGRFRHRRRRRRRRQPGASTLGSLEEVVSFDVESSNTSGYDQIIAEVTLNLDGDIVSSAPVPEPATIPLLATGLGMLFFAVRRGWRRG